MWVPDATRGLVAGWELTLHPTCTLPGCTCTVVDARVQPVTSEAGQPTLASTRREAGAAGEPFEVSIELMTGRVSEPREHSARGARVFTVACTDTSATALQRSLPGFLLEALWSDLERGKGNNPDALKSRPPPDWIRGSLVDWRSIAPNARPDFYDRPQGRVAAEMEFCAEPDCNCEEAIVAFLQERLKDLPPGELSGKPGSVRVPLDGSPPCFEQHDVEDPPSKALREAWEEYVARWPDYLSRLESQYRRGRRALRANLGQILADPSEDKVASTQKIGRNEPCPCGSGKKYKRCCLSTR